MKSFLLTILFMTSSAQASTDFKDWKWGVGFNSLNGTRGGVHAEVGTKSFYSDGDVMSSLFLTFDAFGTEVEDPDEDYYSMSSAKLMYELRHPPYKELVSLYFRIGGGYNWMNKYVHSNGGFGVAGFQLGADFVAQERPEGVVTFFAQVGQDFFLKDQKGERSKNLDGTIVTLGVRRVY